MKLRYYPDLACDLAECDANYVRLGCLLNQMRGEDQLVTPIDSGAVAGSSLILEVLERSPYTLLIKIDLILADTSNNSGLMRWPSMQVRIYHDVKTAEVILLHGIGKLKGRYEYPNRHMHHPDEKSQANRLLGELLALCLSRGRLFNAVAMTDRS